MSIKIPLMGEEKYWRRLRCGFCLLLGVDALLTSEEQLSLHDCATEPGSTEASPGQSHPGPSRIFGTVPFRWWRSHLAAWWASSCFHPRQVCRSLSCECAVPYTIFFAPQNQSATRLIFHRLDRSFPFRWVEAIILLEGKKNIFQCIYLDKWKTKHHLKQIFTECGTDIRSVCGC